MKTLAPALPIAAALLALALNLHSQAPQPKSPAEQLTTLKAQNAELLARQKATLLRLEEIDKQAEQVRFFVKRG